MGPPTTNRAARSGAAAEAARRCNAFPASQDTPAPRDEPAREDIRLEQVMVALFGFDRSKPSLTHE
ncbi:hypothetical protein ABH926_006099 [Catenulispora sp. GP43]|uniref:hypothetical protein n=1 Tax=Catenulispora sp. GP43 TaxID=3156263 RepID=UPI0035164EA2